MEKVVLKGSVTFNLGYSRPEAIQPEEYQKVDQNTKASLPSFSPFSLLLELSVLGRGQGGAGSLGMQSALLDFRREGEGREEQRVSL